VNGGEAADPRSPAGKAELQPPGGRGGSDAGGVRTHGMRPTPFMRTRQSQRVPAELVGLDKRRK
jgi:hypothetical protein